MAEFVNTVDLLGDDAVIDSIIDRSIAEFADDVVDYVGHRAFCQLSLLKNIYLPNCTKVGNYAFTGCTSLENVNMPLLTVVERSMFNGCSLLRRVTFPSVTYTVSETASGAGAFANCTSLDTVDLWCINSIGSRSFMGCGSLLALVIRTDAVCNMVGDSALLGTPIASGTGYVYVPRKFLSDEDDTMDYRRATNWSIYATQFRALEDYTIDGTITGELDETKI